MLSRLKVGRCLGLMKPCFQESAKGHVPPSDTRSKQLSHLKSAFLLPLSANDRSALEAMARNLASADLTGVDVVDIAYTLGERRTKHVSRGYFLASQSTLSEDLRYENFRSNGSASVNHPIGFVFTGQGAQWAQMGKELLEELPVFKESIMSLDSTLKKLPHPPSFSILDVILEPAGTSQINQVHKSQPACTAIQVALVQLLRGWGIRPVGVVGHSSGEIAAAYAAGLITAAEAISIAYYRGYVIEKLTDSSSGAMLATALSKAAAEEAMTRLSLAGIRVACVNSPESVTISGDAPAIDSLYEFCQEQKVFARKLATDGRAYHSHHIAAIGREYDDLLRHGLASLPREELPGQTAEWVSSLTGEKIEERVPASYWRQNAESPVLFSQALEGLVQDKKLHLVEVGPHPALSMPVKQIMAGLGRGETEFRYSPVMLRGKHSVRSLLASIGDLFVNGHAIDLGPVNYVEVPGTSDGPRRPQGKVLPDLPPYPWTYDKILWNESRASWEFRNRRHTRHELLGSQPPGTSAYQTIWRNLLSIGDVPWIQDHKLGQDIVFPGAGYLAMALEAARQVGSPEAAGFSFRQVRILKALVLSGQDARTEIITSTRPMKISATTLSDSWFEFEISSVQDNASTLHATGLVGLDHDSKIPAMKACSGLSGLDSQPIRTWYTRLGQAGMNFGPIFQSLARVQGTKRGDLLCSRASIQPLKAEPGMSSEYTVHPVTIDALFQAALHPVTSDLRQGLTGKVPVSIASARFRVPKHKGEGSSPVANASSRVLGFGSVLSDCELCDGEVLAQITDLQFVTYQAASQDEDTRERHPILR